MTAGTTRRNDVGARTEMRRSLVHLVAIAALATATAAVGACDGGGAGTPGGDPQDDAATERGAAEGMRMDIPTGQEEGSMEGMPGMEMEGAAGPTVRLQPGQAERIGLRWGEAAIEPLVRTVRTSAVVEYPESEMVWVSPKVSGWVEKLHVTFEGAPVRAGQPLLDLYSPELVTAQEELLLAERLDRALGPGRAPAGAEPPPAAPAERGAVPRNEDLRETARRRLRYWDIPEAQIDRLLKTGEVRKTMTLHAPATGVVMRKEVFEGQGVEAGENLFMIAPTDPVWIEAAVYEQDLPFVREGLPVEVSVEGVPDRPTAGRVAYVYPQLRESTRTVVARIEIPNPRGELKPGMYATVRIESRTGPVLSVPSSAILHTGARDVVFMEVGGNRLMPMVVETGRVGDERVEVLAGLEPGARVATSAQFLLDSESNLMEAMQAMMAQMGRVGMEEMEMEGMEGMEMEGMDSMPGGGPRDSVPADVRDTASGGTR